MWNSAEHDQNGRNIKTPIKRSRRHIDMEIQTILRTTVGLIEEFQEQAGEIVGSDDFLEEHIWSLQSGISTLDNLDTDEKQTLLKEADGILEIIADEIQSVDGSPLKVAIVQALRRNIRTAIKG
jgi:hypothetical protein